MQFTSFGFLACFGVLLTVYYLVPKKAQWVLLLAASYGFYLLGGLQALGFILLTTATTYLAGYFIGRRLEQQDAYLAENKQMEAVKRQLDTYIEQNDLNEEISTVLTEDGLMIRIKENALFPSGSAELTAGVQKIGPVIAALVAPIPQRILVTGHTDNVPITSGAYPSNWELSSARAINFMKYIIAQDGRMNPARFSAMGRSEYRPIADNATEDGRAQNRRVEVLIERSVHVDKSEYQVAR